MGIFDFATDNQHRYGTHTAVVGLGAHPASPTPYAVLNLCLPHLYRFQRTISERGGAPPYDIPRDSVSVVHWLLETCCTGVQLSVESCMVLEDANEGALVSQCTLCSNKIGKKYFIACVRWGTVAAVAAGGPGGSGSAVRSHKLVTYLRVIGHCGWCQYALHTRIENKFTV